MLCNSNVNTDTNRIVNHPLDCQIRIDTAEKCCKVKYLAEEKYDSISFRFKFHLN